MINITAATTAELLAFFNANTGGAQVKKFADRKTAERRVQALVDEIAAEGSSDPYAFTGTAEFSKVENITDDCSVTGFSTHGLTHCPSCGVHLSNGVGEDGQEVNGKAIRHDAFQYECLGCGHEFGPAIVKTNHYVRPSGKPITSRPEMAASLKLDRQILSVTSGNVYANACQVWKAGMVTAAQGDRLSAVLYGEAKRGNRHASLTIGNYVFTLAVK
jgi:hypothetical protein